MAQTDGFDEFVASRGPDLRRLAFALTSDRRDAEELVERTLARCLSSWRRIDKEKDAYDFAREVLVRQRIPRHARRHSVVSDRWADGTEAGERSAESPDADLRDELLRGLPGLRGAERTVTVLRLLEGLPEAETAAALRCSVNAVRRHEQSALARVRESAAGVGTGPPDRARRVRHRVRSRRRYQAAAVVAAVALGGVTVTGFTDHARSSAPIASGPTPVLERGTTTPSAPVVPLPPRSLLVGITAGAHVVRMRQVGKSSQLWLYDAITLKPIRALLPPDDATTSTGITVIDPDRDDRVVFVRHVTVPVAATDDNDTPPLYAWRLDELSLTTGQFGVLTKPRVGAGPDELYFSGEGHRLAIVTANEVEVLNTFDDYTFPVNIVSARHTKAIGFLAPDGPLLVSELQAPTPAQDPTRQIVTTRDLLGAAPDGIVYDSTIANCTPTQQVWAIPSGNLILRTRCGPQRTDPRTNAGLGFWVVDNDGPHRIAESPAPDNYRESVTWDSTGATLVEQFTPICSGSPVLDRVSVTGTRTHVSGSFVQQTCG